MTIRRAFLSGTVLVAALAVSACSSPATEPVRTSTIPRGSTSTPVPSAETSAPPAATATTSPAEWTPEVLTEVCVDFQAEWATDNNYAPDDFSWNSPGTTQLNGGVWYVFIDGTFSESGSDGVQAEFSCAISGTPDAPVIVESEDE